MPLNDVSAAWPRLASQLQTYSFSFHFFFFIFFPYELGSIMAKIYKTGLLIMMKTHILHFWGAMPLSSLRGRCLRNGCRLLLSNFVHVDLIAHDRISVSHNNNFNMHDMLSSTDILVVGVV
jgi:hypothetical protein